MKDHEGYNEPAVTLRQDSEGVIVNSPWNKDRVKYKTAESLNIHRDQSVKDLELVDLGHRIEADIQLSIAGF